MSNFSKKVLALGGMRAFVIVEDMIWGSLIRGNALVKIPIKTWELEVVDEFPRENISAQYLHSAAFYHEGDLYFVPRTAKGITKYNIEKREFITIEIKDYENHHMDYVGCGRFENALQIDQNIFMISYGYPAIIKLNLEDDNLEYFEEPIKLLDEKIKNHQLCDGYFINAIKTEKGFAAVCALTNSILLYDSNKDEFNIKEYDESLGRMWAVAIHDDYECLADPFSKAIYINNDDGMGYKKYELNFCTRNAIAINEKTYFFSFKTRKQSSIIEISNDSKIKNIEQIKEGIYGVKENAGIIYAMSVLCGKMFTINTVTGQVDEHIIDVKESNRKKLLEMDNLVINENQVELEQFLRMI